MLCLWSLTCQEQVQIEGVNEDEFSAEFVVALWVKEVPYMYVLVVNIFTLLTLVSDWHPFLEWKWQTL